MPEKKTIMDYLEENIKQTVTLQKLVRLLGEGIDITVKDGEGRRQLTPYLLTLIGDKEACAISIYDASRVTIVLKSPEKEESKNV